MKTMIGCEEWCAFPELSLPAVKARVDSGAKTSSLHAFNIETFERDGQKWVRFDVHPVQKSDLPIIQCEHVVVDRRAVKSSSGESEKRHVISTSMKLGEQSWDVELTLTNRDSMGYRMLLGREAMNGRITIDPSESFMLGNVDEDAIHEMYDFPRKRKRKKSVSV